MQSQNSARDAGFEDPRSEGGTRSPLRVAKFGRRSRTYLASSGGAADPPSKVARLMKFRAVRDLIECKVKTLLETLE
jgi:hypothetical protein